LNKVRIHIKKETRDRLAKLGTKTSTWDSILVDITKHVEKCDRWWCDK